jgi:hypothetical protein
MCGGDQVNRLFTIKCLVKENPISLILSFTAIVTFLLAVMIQIVEYGIVIDPFDASKRVDNRFLHLGDTLWFVYITYATVGFGDYYPKTNMGRIIALVTSLIGSFALSLLVVMMEKQLLLIPKEKNVRHMINFL